jgi:hypothetical protein
MLSRGYSLEIEEPPQNQDDYNKLVEEKRK